MSDGRLRGIFTPNLVPLDSAGRIDEAELRQFLSSRIAAFKVPARIHFSDDPLPRLGTGKIDRVELREKFAH